MSIRLCFVVALILCGAGFAKDVVLVRDGVAKCRIVVAEDASRPEKFGARELATYFEKVTGCGELAGAYPIRVTVDANNGELREDGFILDVRTDGLDIVGQNPRGALYGCYEILKRWAGMRWLVPGEDGEYCVHTGKSIVVPVGREVQNAYLRIRETRANTDEGYLWHARNNMHSEAQVVNFHRDGKRTKGCDRLEELAVRGIGLSGHIMSDLLIGSVKGKGKEWKAARLAQRDRIFAEHPEWFPLLKGQRTKISGPGDANPCVSNPALLDHLASNLVVTLSGPHARDSWVTIGNNDTTIWCECEKCRAIDAPERKLTKGERSDRYWHLVTEIAKRVWRTYPDAKLGGWAYQDYWYPPVKVKIDPRLKVFVSYNNMCWRHSVDDPQCQVNAEWRRIYRMWMETKLPFVVDREPVGGYNCYSDYYEPGEDVLYRNFKAFREYGCGGAHFVLMGAQPASFSWDTRPPWRGKNLGWYAMWQGCYISAKAMWNPDFDLDATLEEANRLYYGKAWEGGMKAFRDLRRECFFGVKSCSGWGQGAPLGPVLDRPGAKERLIALLEQAIATAKEAGDERSLRHLLRDKEIFGLSWLAYREQYERCYREHTVRAKTGTIVVDGELDEADWRNAAPLEGFTCRLSHAVKDEDLQKTVARVVYDPDALYIAVEAFEADFANMTPGRNHIELFYSFPDMADKCYQMLVWEEGKHVTWLRKSGADVDKDFVSKAEVAVKRHGDRWTVEVAVPTTEIGAKCLPGANWKLNVARNREAKGCPREQSSTASGFYYGPAYFVNLKFR